MSLDFIFDLIIVLCLGTMLYMVARVLPKVNDKTDGNPEFKTPRILIFLEKADEKFKKNREKLLRRIRVVILKFDNYLSGRLSKFKKNGEKNGGLHFDLKKEVSSYPETKEKEEEKEEDLDKEEDSL